jgi:endonuclease YncB( thermonuclease family)
VPGFSFGKMNITKLLTALALASALACSSAATITGRVVAVADGDTVTVLDASNTQHKIRLSGIDAPEKNQPFGMRSKQSLSDLVFDRQVDVETDKRDKYGREVGKILITGQDVNLTQVTRGFAWHYKQYEREQSANDRKLYDAAEREARSAKRGLWADADPVPPWEFRHKRK